MAFRVARHVTDAMSLLNDGILNGTPVGATFRVARHVTDAMSLLNGIQVGATFRVARHVTDGMSLLSGTSVDATLRVARHVTDATLLNGIPVGVRSGACDGCDVASEWNLQLVLRSGWQGT